MRVVDEFADKEDAQKMHKKEVPKAFD